MKKLGHIREEIINVFKKSDQCVSWFVEDHFLVVEKFAKQLCKLYPEANKKAVMLSVWFHDIGRAFGKHKGYDIYGAEYAKQYLAEKGFDRKLINIVYEACKSHSCKKYKPKSLEGKILATADAMSHFEKGFYLKLIYEKSKKKKYPKLKKWLLNKIERDYHDKILIKEVKLTIKPIYFAWKKVVQEINLLKD